MFAIPLTLGKLVTSEFWIARRSFGTMHLLPTTRRCSGIGVGMGVLVLRPLSLRRRSRVERRIVRCAQLNLDVRQNLGTLTVRDPQRKRLLRKLEVVAGRPPSPLLLQRRSAHRRAASAMVELVNSMRLPVIAIAKFIASALRGSSCRNFCGSDGACFRRGRGRHFRFLRACFSC